MRWFKRAKDMTAREELESLAKGQLLEIWLSIFLAGGGVGVYAYLRGMKAVVEVVLEKLEKQSPLAELLFGEHLLILLLSCLFLCWAIGAWVTRRAILRVIKKLEAERRQD